MGLITLGIVLLVLALLFTLLKPQTLRKVLPGWEWIEARMWDSKLCGELLLSIKGIAKYEESYLEWLKNSKYSKVGDSNASK